MREAVLEGLFVAASVEELIGLLHQSMRNNNQKGSFPKKGIKINGMSLGIFIRLSAWLTSDGLRFAWL